jgi:xanthine dehydrogenase/oxidase
LLPCLPPHAGGGFGGKESRSGFLNAACAIPAYHLRRPVRIVLDRDEDMQITGQRHAFMGRYKVGAMQCGAELSWQQQAMIASHRS